ncbi:hypothetical protein M408DRAFT_20458 [Serendipita vermifera MAFF 305830]|uniref:Uncharacterized protein n=1 Tax=Serendipita vermifera MAFF 305830 TaxID=933852 RepID=A0A0C3B5N0_SERVB|nr:hypothetical protein M408DRAFT_20458 [Serendipita vermifera MAFF 305830]
MANPSSTAPYQIFILYGGYQPLIVATEASHGHNWTVDLPVGGPYILSMKDANDYTGGTSFTFIVQDPAIGVTCDATSQYSTNSLQVTSAGTYAECSSLVVTVQGGTSPYTMQIFAAHRPPKTTTWTTSTMSYTIDLQPPGQFFVMVTDSTGLRGVEGIQSKEHFPPPSRTIPIPPSGSSSSSSSSLGVQNTQTTTTTTTVITGIDEPNGTYTCVDSLSPNPSDLPSGYPQVPQQQSLSQLPQNPRLTINFQLSLEVPWVEQRSSS